MKIVKNTKKFRQNVKTVETFEIGKKQDSAIEKAKAEFAKKALLQIGESFELDNHVALAISPNLTIQLGERLNLVDYICTSSIFATMNGKATFDYVFETDNNPDLMAIPEDILKILGCNL